MNVGGRSSLAMKASAVKVAQVYVVVVARMLVRSDISVLFHDRGSEI